MNRRSVDFINATHSCPILGVMPARANNLQVLLVPHEPTMEWKRLVLKFATNDRVTYLKGDLRNTTDLTRASAHTASSCFILTNR